ncbi:DUF1847 domain-containing protein [bacterium]|nr:DUF1847 domain-containing protein [bacterium]
MVTKKDPRCARCEDHVCSEGVDCFDVADAHMRLYRGESGEAGSPEQPVGRVVTTADDGETLSDGLRQMHRAATAIEGRHYCRETRLREIILFAREMGFAKLGLVFCIGLAEEAAVVERVLSQYFDVVSVCCKAGGIDKRSMEYEQIDEDRFEAICNSAGQAELLNEAGTQFNIICGLCVGHDAVFTARSKAPVTTFIAKDRVRAHNPAAAVWCRYIRNTLESSEE